MIATNPSNELESLAFHRGSETYRAEFDQERIPASEAVTALLSAVHECGPTEIPPLYEAVDPEALDTLVRVRAGTNGDVTVVFSVGENEVTVYSYGTVAVALPEGDRSDTSSEQTTID